MVTAQLNCVWDNNILKEQSQKLETQVKPEYNNHSIVGYLKKGRLHSRDRLMYQIR